MGLRTRLPIRFRPECGYLVFICDSDEIEGYMTKFKEIRLNLVTMHLRLFLTLCSHSFIVTKANSSKEIDGSTENSNLG